MSDAPHFDLFELDERLLHEAKNLQPEIVAAVEQSLVAPVGECEAVGVLSPAGQRVHALILYKTGVHDELEEMKSVRSEAGAPLAEIANLEKAMSALALDINHMHGWLISEYRARFTEDFYNEGAEFEIGPAFTVYVQYPDPASDEYDGEETPVTSEQQSQRIH